MLHNSNVKPSMALAWAILWAAGGEQGAPGTVRPTRARAQWLHLVQVAADQVQPQHGVPAPGAARPAMKLPITPKEPP